MPRIAIKIRVTVPKEILSAEGVKDAIVAKMKNKTVPEIRRLFEGTTEGWKNRPYFNTDVKEFSNKITGKVWPGKDKAGQIYRLVALGSPPHMIIPRRWGRRFGFSRLRFQIGYFSASLPNNLISRSARRYGPVVSPFGVSHPGFPPRNFHKIIAEGYTDIFARDMQDAVHEAVTKKR